MSFFCSRISNSNNNNSNSNISNINISINRYDAVEAMNIDQLKQQM